MKILAIDPGNTESAFVLMNDDYTIGKCMFGKYPNNLMLKSLKDFCWNDLVKVTVVIEMVASYGMAVGKEVFDTCVWIGRFSQAAVDAGCRVEYIYRMEEKMTLCHNSRAKDSNIRQALIDRFAKFDFKNGRGTKANPDTFYGFAKDIWSAFAVGVTFLDKEAKK